MHRVERQSGRNRSTPKVHSSPFWPSYSPPFDEEREYMNYIEGELSRGGSNLENLCSFPLSGMIQSGTSTYSSPPVRVPGHEKGK